MENENEEIVDEVLEQTNESENTDTQTVEQNVEEIQSEEKKSFKDLLKENPDYQNELNSMVKDRIKRSENRIKKEYESKYSHFENVIKAGMETSTADEAISKMEKFYEDKGINIPKETQYSDNDLKLLAKAEADSITDYDELVDEVERLVEKGFDNLSPREKLVYKNLAERRQEQERKRELAKIGAKREILESKEFKEFSNDYKADVPMSRIYENYLKQKPAPEAEPMDSLKNNNSKEEKTYYTPEEVDKLTSKELDNPIVQKNVRASMLKWGKK